MFSKTLGWRSLNLYFFKVGKDENGKRSLFQFIVYYQGYSDRKIEINNLMCSPYGSLQLTIVFSCIEMIFN